MIVWTVGHSTHTIAELAAIVKAHGVDQIIDIRTIRRSRANPQINQDRIKAALAKREVGYRVAAALGGRRGKAKKPPSLAHAVWGRRLRRIVADWPIAKGVEVRHIMSKTSAPEAELTPFAKIARGRVHYPA